MRRTAIVCTIVTLASPALAEVTLSDVAANNDPVALAFYLKGVLDGAEWTNAVATAPRPFCIPGTLDLSIAAFKDMTLEFAKRHGTPTTAKFPSIATSALMDAFPCK